MERDSTSRSLSSLLISALAYANLPPCNSMLVNVSSGAGWALLCSIRWFLQCKYSHRGPFQATNMMSRTQSWEEMLTVAWSTSPLKSPHQELKALSFFSPTFPILEWWRRETVLLLRMTEPQRQTEVMHGILLDYRGGCVHFYYSKPSNFFLLY